MKKSQINAILVERAKRRNTIAAYVSIIVVLVILTFSFVALYINKSKNYTVGYKEDSNINYKVYLKDNPFFKEQYLENGNVYLETLIDYIDTDFKYHASLEQENVDFKYTYKIDANVEVKTKNGKNPIYKFKEELLNEIERYSSGSKIDINEKLKIDYNYYNDLIKDFIKAYGLDNIDAKLKVNMHINVIGSCDQFENNAENESVMSLIIPLTTKTVDINISDDLIETDDNIIMCNSDKSMATAFLILTIITICLLLLLVIKLIKYIIETRTAEDIYHIELGKILNNYGSYIQEVDGSIELSDYEVWRMKSFDDMMEISDRVNQPILMIENKDKTGVYFIIPNLDKRLYTYGFKVSEIQEQMKENYINKTKGENLDGDF